MLRRKPNPDYVAWLATVEASAQLTSVIVAGELLAGVEAFPDRQKLRHNIEKILARVKVLGLDIEVARTFGRVGAQLRIMGMPIGDADTWIAATAIHYDLTVVSANVRHFERVEGLLLRRVG